MKNKFGVVTLIIAIVFNLLFYCCSYSQEDENRLARPEWQLRADLEFQLACQKAKDMLCREIVRSVDTDSESGSRQLRLREIAELLEQSGDQVPLALPLHNASLAYIENRKAAVIAWLKTYKAKGRELSKMTLDRERAFVAEQTIRFKGLAEKSVDEPNEISTDLIGDKTETVSESSSEPKADSKLREVTSKSIQFLIEERSRYHSLEIKGDTTAAKQLAILARDKAMLATIDKQPSWFLTFPILDIKLGEKDLVLTLDEPLELAEVRERTENRFVILHEFSQTAIKSPSIIRRWKSIKIGDSLRVKFDVQVQSSPNERKRSFSLFSLYKQPDPNESRPSQSVSALTVKKAVVGEPLGFFEFKKILDMQIVRPTTKSDADQAR